MLLGKSGVIAAVATYTGSFYLGGLIMMTGVLSGNIIVLSAGGIVALTGTAVGGEEIYTAPMDCPTEFLSNCLGMDYNQEIYI